MRFFDFLRQFRREEIPDQHLSQAWPYEKGQGFRRMTFPTELEEKQGLGKFDMWTNLTGNTAEAIERELNKTIPLSQKQGYNKEKPSESKIIEDMSVTEWVRGIYVASASASGFRLEKGFESLGAIQAVPTYPDQQPIKIEQGEYEQDE